MSKMQTADMILDYTVDPYDHNWISFDWSKVKHSENPNGYYEVRVPMADKALVKYFDDYALRGVMVALPLDIDVLAAVKVFSYFVSKISGLSVDEVKNTGDELYAYKNGDLLYVLPSVQQHITEIVDLKKLNGMWPISSDILVEYILTQNEGISLIKHSGLYLSTDPLMADRIREIVEDLRANNTFAIKIGMPMKLVEAIVSEWAGTVIFTGVTTEGDIFVVIKSSVLSASWWHLTFDRIGRGLLPEVEVKSRRLDHPAVQMKVAIDTYLKLCEADEFLYDYVSDVRVSSTSGQITVCLYSMEQLWIFSNDFHRYDTSALQGFELPLEEAIQYVQQGDLLVRFGKNIFLVTAIRQLQKLRSVEEVRKNILAACPDETEPITFDELTQFTTEQLLNTIMITYGDTSRCYTRHSLSMMSIDPFTRMALMKNIKVQTKSRIVVNLWPHPSKIPSVLTNVKMSPHVKVPHQYVLDWSTEDTVPGMPPNQSAYVNLQSYILEIVEMMTSDVARFKKVVAEAWSLGFFLNVWCADYLNRNRELLPGSIENHEIISDAANNKSISEQALAYLESWTKLTPK